MQITINGKTLTVTTEGALRQLALSEAALAAMSPIAEQAHNRHASAADIARAQAEQDAKRAKHAEVIAAIRAALEAA